MQVRILTRIAIFNLFLYVSDTKSFVKRVACTLNFPPFISRDRDCLTCPAKVYQVEVEDSACVAGLWPEIPAVFALHRLK
jgi:hypothetical protein